MVILRRLFPLLCLTLLGVGASNADDAQRLRRVAFALDGFESGISKRNARGDAEENVFERFGRPDYTASTTQWEGDGLFQTTYWYYDGLKIRISQPVAASHTWFGKIILTNPAAKLKFGLSIGSKKSEFLNALGPSDPGVKPTSHSLVYQVTDARNKEGVAVASYAGVAIFFDPNDRAEKIVWDYYAD